MLEPNEASSIGIRYPVTQERLETEIISRPEALPTWKRFLDVCLVLISLPVTVPLGVVIAAFIKWVSPGPAFFRQHRVGAFGKPFMCLKFRTMKVNADTTVHETHLRALIKSNRPTNKLDFVDSRLIFGGMILRALGLDELPQLINILRGEMSLVGPRPCTPYEFELFSARHKKRCDAAPGLTGLWQVSGKNRTTFEQQMDLDLYYVDHKSLWMDLKIIAMTVPAILALVWEVKTRKSKKTAVAAISVVEKPRSDVP